MVWWLCWKLYVLEQQCRSFFAMEAIANLSLVSREHRAGCRLRPALLLARRNQLPDAVRSRNPSKFTLAHDAVAAVVLHKHHSITRVGAGLIQFVCRSQLRLTTEATLAADKIGDSPINFFYFYFRVFSKE